jgi:hypothetical protein
MVLIMNEKENYSLGIKELDEVNTWDKKWLQYYAMHRTEPSKETNLAYYYQK